MEHAEFVVFFDKVPSEGLERHWEIPDAAAAGMDLVVPLEGDLVVDLTVERYGRKALVHGTVSGTIGLECSRCLKSFFSPFTGDLETTLLEGEAEEGGEDRELSQEELEVRPFEKGVIDLRELIAEQVHLAVPVKPLCSEECKGLCAHCGADLGSGGCSCTDEQPDPRWEALRKLKET